MNTEENLYTVTFMISGNKYLTSASSIPGSYIIIGHITKKETMVEKGEMITKQGFREFTCEAATEDEIISVLMNEL